MRLQKDERHTLSKNFGGQVRNTGGAIFSTGEAHVPPVKQLKTPCNTSGWMLID